MKLREQFILYFVIPLFVDSLWTRFDLVRNWAGAWGSPEHTSFLKINSKHNGGPSVLPSSSFGSSVAYIGDLDLNGYADIAVGAKGEKGKNGHVQVGAVYILFMGSNRTVIKYTRIGDGTNGGPSLNSNDNFGSSIASIGDLDGDNITDIVVGAPSIAVASVYILYLARDGSAKNRSLIRGIYYSHNYPDENSTNTAKKRGIGFGVDVTQLSDIDRARIGDNFISSSSSSILPATHISNGGKDRGRVSELSFVNGPPIRYESGLGSALAGIGDLDGDGVPDIAVAASESSSGDPRVYILFMMRNGTVHSYTKLDGSGSTSGLYIPPSVSNFGSSILALGDLDGDGVTELAVGANLYDDGYESSSGVVFVFFMRRNGLAKSYTKIAERVEQAQKFWLPLSKNDACGSALGSIGDINLDKPWLPSGRKSVPDIVMGCPQNAVSTKNIGGSNTPSSGIGKIIFLMMNIFGHEAGFTVSSSDSKVGFSLSINDNFGSSLAGFVDLDHNGIRELLVGAPGDSEGGVKAGAIYVMFFRRKRFHSVIQCYTCLNELAFIVLGVIGSIALFIAIYILLFCRRQPDAIELAVNKAGIERGRKRKAKFFSAGSSVAADNDGGLPPPPLLPLAAVKKGAKGGSSVRDLLASVTASTAVVAEETKHDEAHAQQQLDIEAAKAVPLEYCTHYTL